MTADTRQAGSQVRASKVSTINVQCIVYMEQGPIYTAHFRGYKDHYTLHIVQVTVASRTALAPVSCQTLSVNYQFKW